MKKTYSILILLTLFAFCQAQERPQNNFEDWENKPRKVIPGEKNKAPSDAIILFEDNWESWLFLDGNTVTWPISEKSFSVVPGTKSIQTKQEFGSCQLHVEWSVPTNEDHGESLNWGNSGLYFMGLYEVQVYDSYNDEHKIYYNGQAASIYKQHKPLVNACKPSGEWESFDIIFTAPEFNSDGSLMEPAYFTVLQNGILVQNNVELKGTTNHGKFTSYEKHKSKLPLMIQSHGSAVAYRNIWIREL